MLDAESPEEELPEEMPASQKVKFKEEFIERYSQLTDWEQFKKASLTYLRRSVRVNTLKISVAELQKRFAHTDWKLKHIPWCPEGFWIENPTRRDVGNLLEHHLGYLYIQEAASMIPPLVLNPQPGEIVLDIAAAPGSKTTQMAAMMHNEGLLVANDHKGERLKPLGVNVQRAGATNVLISLMTGQRFRGFAFDKILVDAPCSGTGTIAKSFMTLQIWNPNMVKRLCTVQRSLILTAFDNLKKGGTLVYSTCTMEPEEDEGIIDKLLQERADARLEEITEKELPGLKRSPAILSFEGVEYNPEVSKCLRIWPQDNMTEGFFVTRIRKI